MNFQTICSAFLEFLRNLTPQVLLFSLAIVFTNKIDINTFDLNNWHQSMPFIFTMSIYLLSVFANTAVFIDRAFISLEDVDDEFKKAANLTASPIEKLVHMSKLFWKHKSSIIGVSTAVFLIVQVGFVVVFLGSFGNAATIQKFFHT